MVFLVEIFLPSFVAVLCLDIRSISFLYPRQFVLCLNPSIFEGHLGGDEVSISIPNMTAIEHFLIKPTVRGRRFF